MALKGIDVSNHNGDINWGTVNSNIDFAMIRGGYSLTSDQRFEKNIKACNNLGIPVGVYWFSYALSKDAVLNEAKKCIEVIKPYTVDFPVAFDWEYDSDTYYKKMTGYTLGNDLRVEFAETFLDYIKSQGYKPMLYTNVDYIDNYGFGKIKDKYELWLAHWGVNKPKYECAMWQNSATGGVPGINGYVDTNICYKEYKKETSEDKDKMIEELRKSYNEKLNAATNDLLKEYTDSLMKVFGWFNGLAQ